jgi:3-hydroxyisobutyrate dehydrogenase
MQICKNRAVDGVSDPGFSTANASRDFGCFAQMVQDVNTGAEIAKGNVPEFVISF